MGRDDDWDDEEEERPRRRPRRHRYEDDEDDYDDYRPIPTRARSGAVTGVGVVSIILGSLDLLLGMCLLISSIILGVHGRQGGGFGMFGEILAVVIIMTILVLLWGALTLISGIALLRRRQWARIMVLVLSGIGAALGIFFIIGGFAVLNNGMNNPGARGESFMGFLIYLLIGATLIIYCVWSYIVLLNSRNASEFR